MAKQSTHAHTDPRPVTISQDQALYIIPAGGGGYSCLGFDVLIARYNRLASALGAPEFPMVFRGRLEGYAAYQSLTDQAHAMGQPMTCELSPQLVGLEGHRVEVRDRFNATRRFIVGKSTGWLPIHLEIARRTSFGGMAADREYASVRDLGRVR